MNIIYEDVKINEEVESPHIETIISYTDGQIERLVHRGLKALYEYRNLGYKKNQK